MHPACPHRALTCLLALCSAPAWAAPSAGEARRLLEAGRADEAIPLLEAVVRAEPVAPDGWLLLGAACDAAGRLKPAADAYRAAVRLRPEGPDAHLRLAYALDRLGEEAGAAAAYEAYLARERREEQAELVRWARGRLAALEPAPGDVDTPEPDVATMPAPAPGAGPVPAPVPPPAPSRGLGTIGLQVAAGLGGGLAGAAVGGVIGLGGGLMLEEDCEAAVDEADTAACLGIAVLPFIMASVGMAAGIPVGVWAGGELRGSEGSGWASLAGGLVGAALALGFAELITDAQGERGGVDVDALRLQAAFGAGGSLVGSLLGYHLSAGR